MVNTKMIGVIAIVAVVSIAVAGVAIYVMNDDSDKYVVNYDANGGTGSMSKSKCAPGSTITLSNCNFSNDEHFRTFASWNTKPDGSGISYAPGSTIPTTEAGKMTLYAQWTLYTISDFGIHSITKYDISGGYTYSIYSYSYGGTLTDTVTALGAVEKTFERTQNLKVMYYDPADSKNHTQDNTNTLTKTESRDITYTGTPSTLSTKWGVKNVICINKTENDGTNTINVTEYRDAESFIRYKAVMTCNNYYSGGVTLKNWSMTYTLSSYDVNYGGTN